MTDSRDVRAVRDVEEVEQIHEDSWAIDGGEYVVDRVDEDDWRCGCDDHQYRGVLCKHARRVQMEIGERAEPFVTLGDFAGGSR